jgi:hypothetical protein
MIKTTNYKLYQDLKAKGHQVKYLTKQEMKIECEKRKNNY